MAPPNHALQRTFIAAGYGSRRDARSGKFHPILTRNLMSAALALNDTFWTVQMPQKGTSETKCSSTKFVCVHASIDSAGRLAASTLKGP